MKDAESRVAGSNRLLKTSKGWKLKLKEELVTLRNPFKATIQELEVGVVDEEKVLTKERAQATKIETWLAQTKDLLCLINKKIKAVEEQATFATAQIIKEYKKSVDFEQDVVDARADT